MAQPQHASIASFGPPVGDAKQIFAVPRLFGLITELAPRIAVYETYPGGCLLGASAAKTLALFERICELMDEHRRGASSHRKLTKFVTDRPGHDQRYAIDAGRIEAELWSSKAVLSCTKTSGVPAADMAQALYVLKKRPRPSRRICGVSNSPSSIGSDLPYLDANPHLSQWGTSPAPAAKRVKFGMRLSAWWTRDSRRGSCGVYGKWHLAPAPPMCHRACELPNPTEQPSMPEYPLVSIMIPTYGQARYIREAAESALAQRYPCLEVVVADDCSPDDTRAALEPLLHDRRLRYTRNERNLGRVGNYRHTLFEKARGEWCLNLDGDDFLTDPDFVAEAMALATGSPDIVLVWGNVLVAWDGTATAPPMSIRWHGPPRVMTGEELLLRHSPSVTRLSPPHMACLFHRETAMAADFYRDPGLYSDSESIYRIGVGHNVAVIDRIAGVWRQHCGNATHADMDVQAAGAVARAASLLAWTREKGTLSSTDLARLDRSLAAGCAYAEMAHSIEDGRYARAAGVVMRNIATRPQVGLMSGWWLASRTARSALRQVLGRPLLRALGRRIAPMLPTQRIQSIKDWVLRPDADEPVPPPLTIPGTQAAATHSTSSTLLATERQSAASRRRRDDCLG